MTNLADSYLLIVIILTLSIFTKCNIENLYNTTFVDVDEEVNRILQVFNSKESYSRPELVPLEKEHSNPNSLDPNNLQNPLSLNSEDVLNKGYRT